MKRQNVKKSLKVIPAAFVLSTALFVAPGFSSAEGANTAPSSEKVSLVNSTGQKLASTQQTDNWQSLLPLSNNPNDLFPNTTFSYVKDGQIADYVYLDRVAEETKDYKPGTNTMETTVVQWGSIVQLPDGKVFHPEDDKLITITKDGYKVTDRDPGYGTIIEIESVTKGQKLFTLGLSKEYIKKTNENGYPIDAKVKAAYRWDLVNQGLVGKYQGASWSETVRHGISHEVQIGLSYTLGMEVGLEGIASVNQSVTASFGYNLGITEEKEQTRTYSFNPIPDYKYPYYRGAIYQGKVRYSVEPNALFKEYINSNWAYGLGYLPGTKYKFKNEQDVPTNMFAIVNSQ